MVSVRIYTLEELDYGDFVFETYNYSDEFTNYLNRENYFVYHLKESIDAKYDDNFFDNHFILLIEFPSEIGRAHV